MFCDRCGSGIGEAQNFCPACGKPVRPTPPQAERSRVGSHVRLLGIFWLAVAAMRLIPSLTIFVVSRAGLSFLPPEAPAFVPALIRMGSMLFFAAAVVSFLIGYGLLTWKPWARMLAIVAGGISLLDVPFGTALGIYTLWTLLPESSEREYRAKASEAVNFGQA